MSLTTTPANRCPNCGLELIRNEATQLPLLRHGGYGAARKDVVLNCICGYSSLRERSDVKP